MNPAVFTFARKEGLRGAHVLAAMVGFFGIVLAVNGAMIYSAVSTHTGLVAIEPYRKGLHYNDRIVADERQQRLGWTASLDVRSNGTVLLRLLEADDRPVRGLKVLASLGRPATSRHDIKLSLIETEAGAYEAAAAPPLATGGWLFSFEVMRGESTEPVFRGRRRIWLKP
jgi:nitrogen fixation protein FixH